MATGTCAACGEPLDPRHQPPHLRGPVEPRLYYDPATGHPQRVTIHAACDRLWQGRLRKLAANLDEPPRSRVW